MNPPRTAQSTATGRAKDPPYDASSGGPSGDAPRPTAAPRRGCGPAPRTPSGSTSRTLSPRPAAAITGTGRIAPTNSTCGKQSIGSAIVACAGSPTAAETSSPRPSARRRREQQGHAAATRTCPSPPPAAARAPAAPASITASATASSGSSTVAFAATYGTTPSPASRSRRRIGASVQICEQPVRESEEEPAERDPEQDHHRGAPGWAARSEKASGRNSTANMASTITGDPTEDRRRQPVARQQVGVAPGQHPPLRPARPDAGHAVGVRAGPSRRRTHAGAAPASGLAAAARAKRSGPLLGVSSSARRS